MKVKTSPQILQKLKGKKENITNNFNANKFDNQRKWTNPLKNTNYQTDTRRNRNSEKTYF